MLMFTHVRLRWIIVMVEITITVHQIEITTIGIDSTNLVIMIGDIITQMVSPQLGAIIRIVTQINIKTGHYKTAGRVAIIETEQITIITKVIIGTRGPNMVERVSSTINSSLIATIKLDKLIVIIQHHSMKMIGIWVIQTITCTVK